MKRLSLITDIKNLNGKTVLLRTDYNVQINGRRILDAERVKRTFHTINFLKKHGAKIIICAHLGRPEGEKDLKYSLKPVFLFLKKHYKDITFANDCIGPVRNSAVKKMKNGELLMLENLRFYAGEEKNSQDFAKKLAQGADYYINDAFGVSHRAHASVHAITKLLPSYAGFNLIEEVENLDRLTKHFKRPAIAIIGGAKISTKFKLIGKLAHKLDKVLVGGALANNFFASDKASISESMVEKDFIKAAGTMSKSLGKKLILPPDVVVRLKNKTSRTLPVGDLESVRRPFYIMDIGPQTVKLFASYINKARTLVWNGPLGAFETKPYDKGTNEVARIFAERVKKPPFGVVGGGETVAAINNLKLSKKIDFISTGGGAMLEYLEKGSLPGIEVLKR